MHRLLVVGLAALAALASSGSALAWSWPAEGDVLRPFILGNDAYASGQHRGVDVGGAEGSPVVAPVSGVVSFAGSLPTYGRGVTIATGDGYAVTLVHLGSISVAKGDAVEEGRPVGSMGWSGDAEHAVPSVHLGVRIAAQSEGYVDPVSLLPPRAAAPVAPPAPTPAPAPAPAPAPPVSSPTSSPSPPQAPPAPVAVAPTAPAVSSREPAPQGPEGAVAGSPSGVPASAPPQTEPPAAPFRIGGGPAGRTPHAGVTAKTGSLDRLRATGASSARSTLGNAGPAIRGSAPSPASTTVALVASTPASAGARTAVGDARAAGTPARKAVDARTEVPAGIDVDRRAHGATRHDNGAPADVAPPQTGMAVRHETPAVGEIAHGWGAVGDRRRPAPGVVAAAAALLLLALGASARAARRIGVDGAVLRHDADLLRQLHAAHRSRVHDGGSGRTRSSSAAARP